VRIHIFIALMLGLVCSAAARADDFASDLASCAKGQIDAAQYAFEDGPTAAKFVINHSECVPMLVGGDPLLYALSGMVAVMQDQGVLPKGAQACVDASIGKASQPVSKALDATLTSTGLSSLLPAKGIDLLRQIADGKANATLYDVPGVGIVMDKVSCSCAVASTALDIDKLKSRVTKVIETAGDCGNVAKKLASGAYDAAKAAAQAAGSAAKAAYNTAKKAINSVGCTLGLGGCDDDEGPPFFCTGYENLRAQNWQPDTIANMFSSSFFPIDKIAAQVNACEQVWQDRLKKAAEDAAYKKEQARLELEAEKAGQLGAANGLGLAFRWIPQCADKQCESAISKYADQYTKEIQDEYTIKQQYGSFNNAKTALDKKYAALCKLAVVLSKDRADKLLRDDTTAPAAKRLSAFGCRNFLGREEQYLCAATAGIEACKQYALAGQADLCVSPAEPPKMFAAGNGLLKVLRAAGCIPSDTVRGTLGRGAARPNLALRASVTAQCISATARVKCDALNRGGSGVRCEGPPTLRFNRDLARAPIAPPTVRSPPLAPVAPVEPPAIPPVRLRPIAPIQPRPVEVRKSTLCQFTAGPRRGQVQDYAPMDPITVGSPCHDARGSTGVVIAP
jgi:hypothetical protein